MSLDSEQLEAYRNDVFVARQHKSIFYGPPGYRIPASDEITIIGTGGVDTVDSCNRPQQGDFGVYIKEHRSDGTYRLAFVHPDSIPIDDSRGRDALKELDNLLHKSTICVRPSGKRGSCRGGSGHGCEPHQIVSGQSGRRRDS
jgi:hypothetical protein